MELNALLAQPVALPSLPRAVALLMSELAHEEPSLRRLNQFIGTDPVLAGRLLELANSPTFQLPRQIAGIPEALALLGVAQVRTLVHSATLGTTSRSVPGVNMRPATMVSPPRRSAAAGSTPRTMTLDEPVWPSRGLFTTITISALARGRPSGPTATAGCAFRMFTCSSVMPLEISESAPSRNSSALSGEPVVTSEARKPAASASAPM